MKEIVSIIKSGIFFYCYDTDAIVIHELLHYKIVDNGKKCGFPLSNLDKVINTLDTYRVSYEVIENDKVILNKNYKNNNSYKKYYDSGLKNLEIETRFDFIERKIKNMSYDRVMKLVEIIENEIRK